MKLNPQDIAVRASQVAARLGGVETLPVAPTAYREPLVRRVITETAAEVVAQVVDERQRHGISAFEFFPNRLLNRTLDQGPEGLSPGTFWRGLTPDTLAPRLEEALHGALATAGLEAEVRSRLRRDGEAVVELINVRPLPLERRSQQAERAAQGPTASRAASAQLNAERVLRSAAKIIEGAADKLAALGPDLNTPLNHADVGASTTRQATAELEKAAQQLSLVAKLNLPAGADTSETKAVQVAYVKLLNALRDPESYYRSAQLVDDDVRSFKEQKHGVLGWIAGIIASPERLKSGGFEARMQTALGKIYEQAPLPPPRSRPKVAEAFLEETFPLLRPEALRDAATANFMINLGRSEESARAFEIGGDSGRAAAARRHQAHELAIVFGPSLVTADALLRLADSRRAAENLGDATFAYAGALRCFRVELPPEHGLVRLTASKLREAGDAWVKKLDQAKTRPLERYPRWAMEWVDRTTKELGVEAILRSTQQESWELPFVAQQDDWARALQTEIAKDPPYRWAHKSSGALETLKELRAAIYGPLPLPER